MTIVGMLPWHDEDPETLIRCLRSFGPILDTLVTVDGCYAIEAEHGTELLSSDVEHQIIDDYAYEFGMELIVITPHEPWAGEVHKLDRAFAFARQAGDWIAHLHADYELRECDIEAVRAELAGVHANAVWVPEHTPPHPTEDRVTSVAYPPGGTAHHPFFYRGGLQWTVERRHWNVTWQGITPSPYMLQAPFLYDHRVLHHTTERIDRKFRLAELRDRRANDVGYEP